MENKAHALAAGAFVMAVAALLILAVNLIGGFCLGMISHGLSASEAAEFYITLAVGDALVAQVPSRA